MNKLLIAATAAFFAVTALFGSGAEAGFNNMRLKAPAQFSAIEKAGCGGGYRRVFRKRSYSTARRSVKRKVQVARAPAPSSVSVAKAEPKIEVKAEPKAEVASQNVEAENSSISTATEKLAGAEPVEAAKPAQKKVAAKDVGCKKFFPSVGMTLSVSCE